MLTDFRWPFEPFWMLLLGRFARAKQVALLWVLAAAVEKQLPLSPMVDAFADDTRGPWQRRIRDLAEILRQGTPLPAALDTVPGVLPKSAVLAAHVGAETGTLAAALRAEATALSEVDDVPLRLNFMYLLAITTAALSVLTFLMYFVAPKFRAIFQDFGVDFPAPTQWLFDLSDLVTALSALLVPAFLPLLFIFAWATFCLSLGQIMGAGGLVSQIFSRFALPGVLRNMGIVVGAGRPLTSATNSLAAFHPVRRLRRKLLRVDDDVARGAECWASMQHQGLLTHSQVAVLQAAQRAGNLGWALELLGERMQRRLERRFRTLVELVSPALTLLVGAGIGFIVISMFLPLLTLIHDLS